MKFVVNGLTKCGPRLGSLRDIEKFPNVNLETPLTMLYTRVSSGYILRKCYTPKYIFREVACHTLQTKYLNLFVETNI